MLPAASPQRAPQRLGTAAQMGSAAADRLQRRRGPSGKSAVGIEENGAAHYHCIPLALLRFCSSALLRSSGRLRALRGPQVGYAERLNKCVFFNAPNAFFYLWKAVRVFLDVRLASKARAARRRLSLRCGTASHTLAPHPHALALPPPPHALRTTRSA